ncbi:MAG: hypothetical protein ABIO70_25600 [Pseudomonadota bacterium]
MSSLGPRLPFLAAALLCGAGPATARAAGFHLAKADLLGGISESGQIEAGLGLSLYSEELAGWVTFGDPAFDGGHRVKEWWFESRVRGPVMGTLPLSMETLGFEEPERVGRASLFMPVRAWRLGADHTTGRWLDWRWSGHGLLNTAAAWSADPRSLLFGPSLGLGVNLTWWQGWRGNDEKLINTGKLTLEGGWIAGFVLHDLFYTQVRLVARYDAFGVHQAELGVLGLTGLSLEQKGLPLGLELSGHLSHGDDTVSLRTATSWTVRIGLCYRLMPRPPDHRGGDLLETVRRALEEAAPTAPEGGAPAEAELEPELEGEPATEPEAEPEVEPEPAAEPAAPPAPPPGRGPRGPEP